MSFPAISTTDWPTNGCSSSRSGWPRNLPTADMYRPTREAEAASPTTMGTSLRRLSISMRRGSLVLTKYRRPLVRSPPLLSAKCFNRSARRAPPWQPLLSLPLAVRILQCVLKLFIWDRFRLALCRKGISPVLGVLSCLASALASGEGAGDATLVFARVILFLAASPAPSWGFRRTNEPLQSQFPRALRCEACEPLQNPGRQIGRLHCTEYRVTWRRAIT